MSTLVGMELSGRYRLDAQIGTGGMSTVYRAFDSTLERRVAVKLMHREIASDSDQLERFRREARSVAQLSHPHIVGVIDAGESGHADDPDGHLGRNRPYIVFEYVEGETLKDRIRRCGRLPVTEAIAYAIEIARALGAAHARSIVHRDIKPQNVLIDEEGSAKVTDFGIARSLEEEGLTADGRVLGTTDYVSPEQALGKPVTGQSDIYSLGVVLFEMLTGEVPFRGENQVAVAMKHVREQLPDLQSRRPGVSASLAQVLDRMTDKDLTRRYPHAAAVEHDLEAVLAIEIARSGQTTGEATAILKTLPSDARRLIPFRVRFHPSWLGLILIAGVVVLALVLLFSEGSKRVERGTGAPRGAAPPNTKVVSVKRASASDYDPYGDNHQEHPTDTRLVVDRQPATSWSTETYSGGQPALAAKGGVGLYIDAVPGVVATQLQITTARAGWEGAVYARNDAPPRSIQPPGTLGEAGWKPLGTFTMTKRTQRARLDTATNRFRYYLVWITELPPDSERVEISEVVLYTPAGG